MLSEPGHPPLRVVPPTPPHAATWWQRLCPPLGPSASQGAQSVNVIDLWNYQGPSMWKERTKE